MAARQDSSARRRREEEGLGGSDGGRRRAVVGRQPGGTLRRRPAEGRDLAVAEEAGRRATGDRGEPACAVRVGELGPSIAATARHAQSAAMRRRGGGRTRFAARPGREGERRRRAEGRDPSVAEEAVDSGHSRPGGQSARGSRVQREEEDREEEEREREKKRKGKEKK